MKLYFMKQDALDFMKHNMDRLYTHYYHDNTNNWMREEYGSDLFSEFMDVPDFELADVESLSIGEADFENCKILYNNLRNLSESQCSDERLWAGLCNGTFYEYMRHRYKYHEKQLKKKETDASAIISRFFYSGTGRTGFYRNGLAKCWWVGRSTFDNNNENHFEKLDILGPADLTSKISNIFYSNTFSANPVILSGICDAIKFFNEHGQLLDQKKHIRPAMQYLNAVGGVTLLDVLTEEEICKIVKMRILSIIDGKAEDIEVLEDEDQILEIIEDINDQIDSIESEKIDESDNNFNKEDSQIIKDILGDSPLNWFDKEDETTILKPQYVSYACKVKILNETENRRIIYNIPVKDDNSRKLLPIEQKIMGQKVGFTLSLKGKKYRIIDIEWNDK